MVLFVGRLRSDYAAAFFSKIGIFRQIFAKDPKQKRVIC